jgi:hypothetical protein
MPSFVGAGKPLSESGLNKAAGDLGVGLPALWAVMTVETKGCGFLADRRPLILYERHIFHRRTGGKHSNKAPDISNSSPGGYGPAGDNQYRRLARAIKLDRKAALESTSWGLGQVMGFNFTDAGHASAEAMVAAMCESEDAQFQGMVGFIVANQLAKHLQNADWAQFAYLYNGKDFQKNKYDEKLARAHARFLAGPLPSVQVRAAQLYLAYLGHAPGTVDGWFGTNTQNALIRFQKAEDLPVTGLVNDAVLAALEKAAGTET